MKKRMLSDQRIYSLSFLKSFQGFWYEDYGILLHAKKVLLFWVNMSSSRLLAKRAI